MHKSVLHAINSFCIDEIELRNKCKMAGLTRVATERMVQRYVFYKSEYEIACNENVEMETIKQSLYRSRKKVYSQEPF